MSQALKLLKSTVLGGATAFVFAPLVWPVAIYLQQGHLSSSILAGLLGVALFALIGGVAFALLIGFPLALVLWSAKLTHPLLLAITGGIASAVLFSQFLSWPLAAWPLYGFFLVVGGLCSGVAAWGMRSDPSFKLTPDGAA